MITYTNKNYNIAVIGAGHAGCEAALAAARMGFRTVLFTLTMDLVANLPCNPSIGGTGKGHIVFEIDALGGTMGKIADGAMLQSRMLNVSKGPAVHSLRMQADRVRYRELMRHELESCPNLLLSQAEVVEVKTENGKVRGVVTKTGAFYECDAVIVTTGTSLGGRIIIGECVYSAGPDNTVAATELTKSLLSAGVKMQRFKTGTPPRVHSDSIDYSVMERQPGDERAVLFSSKEYGVNKNDCFVTYTNEKTHQIIKDNLHRSPLFSGIIEGVGARYCPSIEDKVTRFADKERHQLFIEPMGENTKEMYIQGLSSSMPEEVQMQIIKSIKGLENAVVMRTAYAIEYDCCDPTQLYPTLEFKEIKGLYGAGQFNGTSGYEEAAAQGLVAGINAALKLQGREPMIIDRSEGYIGTLIDDIVIKGTNEPYRMMTSRSEYRLVLRQDNAEERLIEKGRYAGLIDDERYSRFLADKNALEAEVERLRRQTLPLSEGLKKVFTDAGFEEPSGGIKIAEALKRPGITYEALGELDKGRGDVPEYIRNKAEIEIKYEGYIKKQLAQIEQFKKLESKQLPADIDYSKIKGIRIEAAQKLAKNRPASVGQASRISGISPADVSVLLIWLQQRGR
ncbi:MAG: tRNA uridine-5-carboxymethylaminomethyl(34) synthesis enzyme MnmG [Eubacteriales bacterium]|nr:tRNA uridine-5-carboxymethylaminomethyl(34) synthesis enzyme MnmG [Eubacteriales bacterium]MDD4474827.1 tRNA uridine-5-carboxymethylaminomethyl(34) synthesis enzyme MnmG [Eubacteriales bacterium]